MQLGCSLFVQFINLVFLQAWDPIRINVKGEFRGIVSQLFAHVQDVIPLGDPEGRIGMSERGNRDPSELGLFQRLLEYPLS